MWFLVDEFLLNVNVSRGFKFSEVCRQIAPRQPGLPLQEEEVRAVDDGEVGHDDEAAGLVDDPIDASDRRELVALCVTVGHPSRHRLATGTS